MDNLKYTTEIRKNQHLCLDEREEIQIRLKDGWSKQFDLDDQIMGLEQSNYDKNSNVLDVNLSIEKILKKVN